MKYKLLKDLPGVPAGEIFQAFDEYQALTPVRHYMLDSKEKRYDMNPVDYPDFFEPIGEAKILYRDEAIRIIENSIYIHKKEIPNSLTDFGKGYRAGVLHELDNILLRIKSYE